jgi:hypothetical protein
MESLPGIMTDFFNNAHPYSDHPFEASFDPSYNAGPATVPEPDLY